MDVVHEKFTSILLRPALAQINHHARVRVPAARRRRAAVARVRPFAARVMNVVADGLDVVVNERVDEPLIRVGVEALVRKRFLAIDVEMLAALPLEPSALNHVPEMRNHAGLNETLAVFVEVDAPRIARAFGEHLEDMFGGMITPHTGVHALSLFLWCAGFANKRRTENTVTTIKPAVRAPGEGVQCLVRVGVVIPAVEENLRITRGFRRVAVLDWNEHEVGRGAYPYAAEAELQSADQIQVIEEHRAPIEFAVAVGVFEDQDAVVAAENVLELFGCRFGTVCVAVPGRGWPFTRPMSICGALRRV